MTIICPNCHSSRVGIRNYGRSACGTLGSIAGAHLAVQGIQMGSTVGRLFGLPGIVMGGAAGLIIAGISGAMLGGSTGTQLGSMIDEKILNNFKCLDCEHTFGDSSVETGNEYISLQPSPSEEDDEFHLLTHSEDKQ